MEQNIEEAVQLLVKTIKDWKNLTEEEKEKDEKYEEFDVKETRHQKKIYQYIRAIMDQATSLPSKNFIIPIGSGTSNLDILKAMPITTYLVATIPLYISDITAEDGLKMLKSI